jgi:UDP-2-acetamido-3-amino-2,3-dideoxy-glucuronate N-acetyltransferase
LVRNFDKLGHLYGLFDSDANHLARFGSQYPGARLFHSYQDVLADPEVDAVVIATPAEQHADMGIAALKAGKDAFIEKPLALFPEDGMELVETARERRRILMVGHLLLYHPAVRKIQELVASGELGRLEYIYSNRLSMGKIRREENALWSFAPHDISVILMLMGHLPLQVTATGGAYVQPNIADVTVSNLLFERGTRAHIFVSWLHPYKEQRLVVIGSKKMVVFEDSKADDKLLLFDKQIEWVNGAVHAASAKGTPVPFDAAEPLSIECAHFADCVRTRRKPITPGDEAVQVLQVLQSCHRSLQLGGEPVQVNGVLMPIAAI